MDSQEQHNHMEALIQASFENELKKMKALTEAMKEAQALKDAIKSCETSILRKTHEMNTLAGSAVDSINAKVQHCIVQFESAGRQMDKYSERIGHLQHQVNTGLNWTALGIAAATSLIMAVVFVIAIL